MSSVWESFPPAHAHVQSWPMMEPLHALMAVSAYFITTFALMKLVAYRGRAFLVKPIVIVHNLNMFVLSLYMCIECVKEAIHQKYSLFGNGVDGSPSGRPMARILWIFFMSKIIEFGDTFIMALRYRFRQITFLHVYHHSSIFLVWFAIVRWAPGGEGYFSCALNSFIHVVMYGYYLWSSTSPTSRDDGVKPSWTQPAFYRRYITRLQLSQFMVMMAQATYDLVVPSPYPRVFAWVLFIYMITMLSLFANFYTKSYTTSPAMPIKEA